jgi:hypothetical protein
MLESIDFDKIIRIDRGCGESGRNSVDCIEYNTSLLSEIKLADLILQYNVCGLKIELFFNLST